MHVIFNSSLLLLALAINGNLAAYPQAVATNITVATDEFLINPGTHTKLPCLMLACSEDESVLRLAKDLKYDLEFTDQVGIDLKKPIKNLLKRSLKNCLRKEHPLLSLSSQQSSQQQKNGAICTLPYVTQTVTRHFLMTPVLMAKLQLILIVTKWLARYCPLSLVSRARLVAALRIANSIHPSTRSSACLTLLAKKNKLLFLI